MSITEDRFRVRTLLGTNMVVEAGAGTGKTTLLIDRLCFALLAQGILAPRLVALTFTEKAAAEIKMRLMLKLQHLLSALRNGGEDSTLSTLQTHFGIASEDIISRAELALSQLDRSPIGTIHSFCADILKTYPLEAGLIPNAEIDKGSKARFVFDTQWNLFLDRELGENATRASLWKEILSFVSLEQLCDCAREMCNGKVEKYDYYAQKDLLINVCQERARQAEELMSKFLEEGKKPRVVEQALQQAAVRFRQAAQWLQDPSASFPAQETISLKSFPKDWDKQSVQEAKDLCLFAAQADPTVQKRILKAYDLLLPFVENVRKIYTEEGILSFDDLIVKTRNLLRDNLFVRRCLQEEYDMFFVDEFQDTDPIQGELILFLAEQKGGGAVRWEDVRLEKGKMFVVGDPKQSIYRFRGADITAYQLFTDLILQQGGEKAYLRQNFRSEKGIIALANDVCEKVMLESPSFQPKYEPIFTDKPSKKSSTELALVVKPEEKISADDYRHNQARFIAQWIEENVGKMELSSGRKLQYKDIVILTRASTTSGPYAEALRRVGIAFSVEEDRYFYHRQEINDFLNFIRAIEDPQDKISLVGVMRSPIGALTDEEVLQASVCAELDWRKDPQNEKLKRLFALLRSYAYRSGREPLSVFIRSLFTDTFLPELSAAAYDAERSIAALEKLVSLSEGYSAQVPSTLGQFLARVEELMEEELGRLTALPEGEGLNVVSMMTVHKSKGLEFPVVILADISKKETANVTKGPSHLYSWRYDLHGLRLGKYADINLAWLEEQQRLHAACEEIRVLYVALTRAREKLLLVGNQDSDEKTIAAQLASAGRFPPEDEQPQTLGGEDAISVLYIDYQPPASFIYQQKSMPENLEQAKDFALWKEKQIQRKKEYGILQQKQIWSNPSSEETNYQDEQAQSLGRLIHGALAYVWQYPQHGLDRALLAAMETGQEKQLVLQAREILSIFAASAVFRNLRSMRVLGIEMPFVQKTQEGLVSGIIDLLLEDEEKNIWVIDFKTDVLSSQSAEQAAQKHKPQLSAYQKAAQALYPQSKIRVAVVFVRSHEMAEL